MRCGASTQCRRPGDENDLDAQYDRYNIYAGRWHEECWDWYGYDGFVFDASYAGESLEEVD
jgi:hypothetical protein